MFLPQQDSANYAHTGQTQTGKIIGCLLVRILAT